MAGVKGRSGRKKASDEEKRFKIIDKAWDVLADTLWDYKVKQSDKIKIAIELCKKNIPVQIDGKLQIDITANLQTARQRVLEAISIATNN